MDYWYFLPLLFPFPNRKREIPPRPRALKSRSIFFRIAPIENRRRESHQHIRLAFHHPAIRFHRTLQRLKPQENLPISHPDKASSDALSGRIPLTFPPPFKG